ncbi:MAG: OadG family protein [Melioribacteraceae bacterium]|nr:OadG family protein [Melioribacteraceae bacterium]MCF8263872.1 OadG family protein [Melioribacteraceae bacterium]MCF8412402.1 OadG family protein [Melioribacteraceae bacterium]
MIIQEITKTDSLSAIKDTVIQSSANTLGEITFAPEKLLESNGLMISIVGYGIVFLALLLLYLFIRTLTKTLFTKQKKRLIAKGESIHPEVDLSVPGEVTAAIGMAINLYFDSQHDIESTVLTIKKVQRPYSPWSSKLYGLRHYPNK